MILLPLLACVLLGALSAQAKVVNTFADCTEFFYKGTEPAGMDQNAKKICQTLNNEIHYATLYSTHHRIPVYSAYTFNGNEQHSGNSRPSVWFIEPQISMEGSDNMMRETSDNRVRIKASQAISSDYSKTGYDRGHLNPNCFQCNEGREATFTLTNAAPMNPSFNRVFWYQWEKGVRDFLKKNTVSKVYLVTGTVPHPSDRIPKREESSNEYERVTVPTHIWTAVCYQDNTDKGKSFSFGYIGQNVAYTSITMMPVAALNSHLAQLYRVSGIEQAVCNPRIFVDECYCSSRKYEEITEYLQNTIKLTSLQQNYVIQMPAKRRCSGKSDSRKQDFSEVNYISMTDFSKDLENMKRNTDRACVLIDVDISRISDLRKRDLFQISDFRFAVNCQQVTEKSDPTAMTAADGTRCQNWKRFCKTEDGFKPCCSTPCLYQETRKDYWCRSGQTEIQCSPQYSSITVNGEKCIDDHQCGTYGKDYYWCKTSSFLDSWDYCSPPLWKSKTIDQKYCRRNHACAKYGKTYTWCYTDSDNNWNYCCNHDDCYSARDGKTCKSDHKCGYHGKDYLWCRTTDGSWEYCCTSCW